jgi:acyl-CoA thioesterase-1
MTQIRIGFVGDSITHGTGDETLLGWTYRVGQAEAAKGHDVTVYNLGIRADTSALVEARWDIEVNSRLKAELNCATVWAIGINDSAHERTATTDGLRVPLNESLDRISRMINASKSVGPALWVGPTPVIEEMMPIDRLPGVIYDFRNGVIETYNHAFAQKAAEISVPYLDLYSDLAGDPDWDASLRASDGLHPNADGYVMMAARVTAWNAWRAWFDD